MKEICSAVISVLYCLITCLAHFASVYTQSSLDTMVRIIPSKCLEQSKDEVVDKFVRQVNSSCYACPYL